MLEKQSRWKCSVWDSPEGSLERLAGLFVYLSTEGLFHGVEVKRGPFVSGNQLIFKGLADRRNDGRWPTLEDSWWKPVAWTSMVPWYDVNLYHVTSENGAGDPPYFKVLGEWKVSAYFYEPGKTLLERFRTPLDFLLDARLCLMKTTVENVSMPDDPDLTNGGGGGTNEGRIDLSVFYEQLSETRPRKPEEIMLLADLRGLWEKAVPYPSSSRKKEREGI